MLLQCDSINERDLKEWKLGDHEKTSADNKFLETRCSGYKRTDGKKSYQLIENNSEMR